MRDPTQSTHFFAVSVPHRPAAQGQGDETALLTRLRRGDPAAFERLVSQHRPRLLAVALRVLKNEDDSLDALQDAFLSAFRAIPRFHGQAQLSTWLHRIVVNACLMKLRSRRRKAEVSFEELAAYDAERLLEARADSRSGLQDEPCDAALQRGQDGLRLRSCLGRLPERYRDVLVLRDLEELDTREAARRLGVSATAVKLRLHRARRALKRQLQQAPAARLSPCQADSASLS